MVSKRIMFVDDEPAVLQSLSNLLRKDRHRWDLVFAPGGPDALVELDRGRFDIVVTDMRMPDVDGVELLEAIKTRSPRTVRIMLSGHAEARSVLQALPLVHQFLAKPCDIRTLRAALERTGDLPGDRAVVGGTGSLPSRPAAFYKLHELPLDPEATIDKMIPVVERDPALAAKVLQIANTPYFGIGAPIASIAFAVSTLGLEVLRPLATSTMLRLPTGLCLRMIDALTERAVASAVSARAAGGSDVAYAAALLGDLGQLVLADELDDVYAPVLDRVARTGESLADVETELLGVTHAEVGAHLFAMWALPKAIIDAITESSAPAPARHTSDPA